MSTVAEAVGFVLLAALGGVAGLLMAGAASAIIHRLTQDRRARRMIAGGRLGSKRGEPLVHYWYDPGADLLCHQAFGGYCRVQEPPMAVWIPARRRGRQP